MGTNVSTLRPRAECSAAVPPPLPTIGDTSLPDELTPDELATKMAKVQVAAEAPPPPPLDSSSSAGSDEPPPVLQYSNPGSYENFSSDIRRLIMLDVHDGCRFDVSKPLSPLFSVVHSFWLGTAMLPDGSNSNYAFVAQVADETGVMMCRLDPTNQSVEGRIINVRNLTPPAVEGAPPPTPLQGTAKGTVVVSPSGQTDQLMADYELAMGTCTLAGRYGSQQGANILSLAYLQSVTPSLALGGEAMYIAANNAALKSVGAKYSGTRPSDAPGSAPSGYTVFGQYSQTQGAFSAAYLRTVTPGRVVVGTELNVNPATAEATVTAGLEVTLRQGKLCTTVDGAGKIQSTLETTVSPGMRVTFCGEADHGKGAFRFGYGLSMGS